MTEVSRKPAPSQAWDATVDVSAVISTAHEDARTAPVGGPRP
jgi:hypothetical protein